LLLCCGLVARASASDEAGASKKKRKAHRSVAAHPAGGPSTNGYRELLVDKMPFGSTAWWDQMLREGRLGHERP